MRFRRSRSARASWASPRRAGVLGCLLVLAASRPASGEPRSKSEAERFHAKGVHCMDVIERNKCAIENFEALLEAETRERELVTDAMMRLIDLYRDEGREDDVAGLMRQFWDVGMKRGSHGHVPWSTRFIPTDLNMMMVLDLQQMTRSKVINTLKVDAQDSMLTCDPSRREALEVKRRFRRAEAEAAKSGGDVWEVMQANKEEEAARRAKRAKKKKRSQDEGPVFIEALCPVVRALGGSDLKAIGKVMGALNHQDSRKSVGVAEVPKLDPMLAQAQTEGRLQRVANDHYILADFEYAGAPVHLLKLDHDELTIAPDALVSGMLAARSKRRPRLNRELEKLVGRVPRDAGFFFVMNQAAMREMGFSGVKRSTRTFLEALLPKPKGLQIAAVFGDSLGLFTRVPTDTPGKGRMLVSLANAVVARTDDAEANKWLEGLDIAESTDRKAVLASYLISSHKLEKLMLE
ncbi:MAG: hypothetical protein AAF721_09045 [Myxococcota bacterium]